MQYANLNILQEGGPAVKKVGQILAAVILLMGLTSGATLSVSAADGGSYDSNGKIGFYGEWTPKDPGGDGSGDKQPGGKDPGDKDPTPDQKDPGGEGDGNEVPKAEDPGDKDPTPDEKTPTPQIEVPGGGSNALPRTAVGADQVAYTDTPKNAKIDGTLPQTGMSPYVTYAGIALLLLAHLFLMKRRNKERDSNNT